MSETTERLIERLAAEAGPVRPLPRPWVRAGVWLTGFALVAGAAVLGLADPGRLAVRLSDAWAAAETFAILATGIAAILAAFHLSLPDRSPAWAFAPLPPLALWIASSGYGCYQFVVASGPDGWAAGSAVYCLRFIVGVGVPLGISLLLVLRRARPIAPVPVTATAGLAVAAFAAFLLDFFHAYDVTVIDLAAHFLAVAIVVGLASLAGRWSQSRAA